MASSNNDDKFFVMLKQNKELLKRLKRIAALEADAAKRSVGPAAAPSPAASPRRSPRKHEHATPRRSPRKHKHVEQRADTPPVNKRHRVTPDRQAKQETPKATPNDNDDDDEVQFLFTKKRTPKPDKMKFLRKTLGQAIKMKFDKQIRAKEFRDSDGVFNAQKYVDAVSPIINRVIKMEEVDTTGVPKAEIFKLALSVAKKRESYTPVKKKSSKEAKSKNQKRKQSLARLVGWYFCLVNNLCA